MATVTNNDGYLVTALSGELRQQGAMRIASRIFGTSEDLSNATYWKGAGAATLSASKTVTAPNGAANDAWAITVTGGAATRGFGNNNNTNWAAGAIAQASIWLKVPSGTVATNLSAQGSDVAGNAAITITTTWQQFSVGAQSVGGKLKWPVLVNGGITDGQIIHAWHPMCVDITGESDQSTIRPYVSVGVLSAPYHGAGVDGVKYFNTDISGNPIPAATLDGSVVEAAATQYLGVTGTPATQTTASLGTGTYTLWCEGTGSCIASAGTATITGAAAASAGAPDQFEVTVAGTVTVTVTGSLTTFNLTNTPYQTSYILNAGAAGTSTTRNKDVLDDQVSGNLTAAAGSVAFQWTPSHAPSGTIALAGSYVDASNYTALLHDATKYIFRKRIAGTNYDAELTAAFVSGTTYSIALTWGASGSNLVVDGVLGTPHANTTAAQLGTRWQWGADGNGGQQAGACFKEKYLWARALSDSEMQAITS
ncbi:MAG: hypothetical protein PHW66_09655 [Gallionella sp.]|nr:hypothetical protein [Gallionella sp.]